MKGIGVINRRLRLVLLGASALPLALFGAAACADSGPDFPERDIKWFVGFNAGGGFDVASRAIAEAMSDELGVNVVVENIPGGGGRRAAQDIYRGEPDGYAISIMNMPNQITAERLDPQGVSFDELQWVGRAVIQTYGMYTTADSEWRTPQDVAAAGDDVRFCLTGLSGHSFLVASVSTQVMNIAWNPVTGYQGTEVQAGLLRGDCELAVGPFAGSTLDAVRSDDFKGLWMYADERFALTPDVPTVGELGFGDLAGFANNGMVAAAPGTPDDIVEIIATAFDNALQNAEVAQKIADRGMAVARLTPQETRDAVAGMDGVVSTNIETVRQRSQSQ